MSGRQPRPEEESGISEEESEEIRRKAAEIERKQREGNG